MNFDKIKGWVADTMVSIVAAKEHVAKVDSMIKVIKKNAKELWNTLI